MKGLYHREDGVQIYLGDCQEIMPEIGSIFVPDVIVTDPPYGETSLDWDKRVRGWAEVASRVVSNMWVFGSLRMFMDMARLGEFKGWAQSQEIVWEKHNGSSFHADRFKRVHELAVHFYRGGWESIYKKPVMTDDATARTVRRKERPPHMGRIEAGQYSSEDGGPRLMRSVIYERSCHGIAEHPTQKPEGILKPLLEYSVPAGGSVLDPFMGSGSVLVAARRMGLSAIGVEVDERYCEIAAKRLCQRVFEFQQ